jgi:UDP-glucose 4-epimerase
VLELAELIWRKLRPGQPFRYVSDDPFEYDVQRRVPDCSKAKRVLGFEAMSDLGTILDEVIPWVQRQIELGTI